MALDFQQVQEQVHELGEAAPKRQQDLQQKRQAASELLKTYAADIESMQAKVQEACNRDPSLRCALPVFLSDGTPQPLDGHYPLPDLPDQATILAADGSQINLDRHAEVEYGLVNVGAIQMRLGSTEPPQTTVRCELIYDERLENMTEARLALTRDLKERSLISELASHLPGPLITFTDGPMELWGSQGASAEDATAYQESLSSYLEVLSYLNGIGAISAGYVDKPAANLVVRLLEVALAAPEDLADLRHYHPLRGVSDRSLFRDLLAPGERTSVFALQSQSAKSYPGPLALHFFYLNVGRIGKPWLARVEAPAWAALSTPLLDSLHAVLVDQCRILGTRPYPYLLHRAHETAVVSLQERDQVTNMIVLELRQRGITIEGASYKQTAKDLPGRTRL